MSSKTWFCVSPFPSPVCNCNCIPSSSLSSKLFISNFNTQQRLIIRRRIGRVNVHDVILALQVDPWSPNIDSQSIASQLFAFSLFPYLAFLYFITKSNSSPKLTLFGFYFLLTFVAATIPAGIYAKVQYGTSLSNVDWLHGGAESFLTLTNLFIVMGLREALRNSTHQEQDDDQTSL